MPVALLYAAVLLGVLTWGAALIFGVFAPLVRVSEGHSRWWSLASVGTVIVCTFALACFIAATGG